MVVPISMIVVVMMMAPIPRAVVSVVVRAVVIIAAVVVVRTPYPHRNVNAVGVCRLRSESNQS
jgi:hypothetical protein